MDKILAVFKTSEGWSLIVAALLGVFVTQGAMSQQTADFVTSIIGGLIAVIFQRFIKKTIAGSVPFQPAPPK